ncbi:MAG: hypothetical protein NT015_00945 [Alphaproteobacteria bacterium]|nr:hypothetical protein [Alphaproteobacteria bacterium]
MRLVDWARYGWAWVKYLAMMGLFAALALAALYAIWWGYQAGGWIGAGGALLLVMLLVGLATEEGREQLSIGASYIMAFAIVAAVVVGGIIGFGYLLGIGMHLAR